MTSSFEATNALREQLLFSAGQDFHDIIVDHLWRHPHQRAPQHTLSAARKYLERVKARLLSNVAAFPATPHLERLYLAQRRVVAARSDVLLEIADRFVDAITVNGSSKQRELRARVLRASASALKSVLSALFDASQATDAGKAFVRMSTSVDRLLAAVAGIEAEIVKRGDDADPEWLEQMQALIAQKRAAAVAVAKANTAADTDGESALADVELARAEWMATSQYRMWTDCSALVERLYEVERIDELHTVANGLLNTGKVSVESGDAFEARVARQIREIVDLCGFDGAWFEECERANGALAPASRDRTDAPWVDQSQTEHSLRCAQLGKPNLRVEFNLAVYVPEKRNTGDVFVASGEVDGLVYDACTNEVLIWIEAKAHAPDLPKADTQRTLLLRKLFTHGGFVSRERSKVPWFSAANFARFHEPEQIARHSVIVMRAPPVDSPIRVPSYVTVSLQRAVWADDDEHLLDQLDSIRMAVVKQNQRSPMAIVLFYQTCKALDRIRLLPFDEETLA
jgi:hypothetical protein